ncbi:ABC transporter substrate-binding protein [Halorubrum laminariae]|uniref:ABC transporter substrate-binding protein n=1 Tax=Halorubrum laminariae TaxID=1433523 RepID=A0ABD6BZT6_9EURY|nr:ABC transporter substrate-binding protein [Halorubrum laminariae]
MGRPISRRQTLAGLAAATASGGCLGRTRNLAGREMSSQLTLQIDAVPADRDPNAIRIARHLAENLKAVGVDARINTLDQTTLWRKVLINQNFDAYVGQFLEPEPFDPDALYAFTHSRFAAEVGRQNPFGFADLNGVDDELERQRRAESDRSDPVADLQRSLGELQPFTVVAVPDPLTAVREAQFDGWSQGQPLSVAGLLSLDHTETTGDATGGDGNATEISEILDGDDGNATAAGAASDLLDGDDGPEGVATLRLVTTDSGITENWNPIAAEYRRQGTFTSLLYDRLVLVDDGEVVPWLATDWERIGPETVEVSLRDASWHDGEPLTAADVAFTYEFLRDTSMGTMETPVPTPRFRGRSSVVQSALAVDDRTVQLGVENVNRAVIDRALRVPILPEHVWRDRTDAATIADFEVDAETTEAVVATNENPVGSGPIRFVEATAEESAVFERNPDHFLARAEAWDGEASANPAAGVPERLHGKPAFDRLEVGVLPSDIAAVQAVGDGFADATVSNLGPDSIPRIGREADARLVAGQSGAFYHVGYNVRRPPLSNPRFRGILASLIDKETLVEEAFDGYAEPASSPLSVSPEWVPDDLRWDDRSSDPIYPFADDPGTGSLDVEKARDLFRDAGYRFDDQGRLLAKQQ